jgi:hypothetical protein
MSTANNLFLGIATIAQTGILIWGFRMVSEVLKSTGKPEIDAEGKVLDSPGKTFLAQVVSEKNPKKEGDEKGSFSRISGVIGSIVLAAFFGGVSYWALFTLFSGGSLDKLSELQTFFLVGSALFAPYAFNQLRSIFQ